jgi:hypothetical protein
MEHLGMSPEELEATIQDVRQRYPTTEFPDVKLDNVFYGMQKIDSKRAEGRQAIVTTLDREEVVSGICSDQYMLIPHEWAVWKFEQILDTEEAFQPLGRANIRPNLLGINGAKMRLEATFPDSNVTIAGDQVNPKAGIKTSYDLSLQWEPYFGGFVKRCTNGLLMWGNLISGGRKHKMSLDLEDNIQRLIEGVEKLDEMFGIWDSWTKKLISQAEAFTMLEGSPLSDKQVENIKELPEIGTNRQLKTESDVTPWFINSIVTQYIEHEMDNTPARLNTEEKVTDYLNREFEKVT